MAALEVEEVIRKKFIIRTKTAEAANAALPAQGTSGPTLNGNPTRVARVELGWNGPDYWTAVVTYMKVEEDSRGQGIVV